MDRDEKIVKMLYDAYGFPGIRLFGQFLLGVEYRSTNDGTYCYLELPDGGRVTTWQSAGMWMPILPYQPNSEERRRERAIKNGWRV